jgi:predicted transcriptional regulator
MSIAVTLKLPDQLYAQAKYLAQLVNNSLHYVRQSL